MNADFESQLQRQPMRELPRHWRAEILAAASGPRLPVLRAPDQGVSTWPSRRAWAALAAVWLLILLLHLTAPEGPRLARNSSPMTLQSFAILRKQTFLMAQILGQNDSGEPADAAPAPPRLRSERAPKATRLLTA